MNLSPSVLRFKKRKMDGALYFTKRGKAGGAILTGFCTTITLGENVCTADSTSPEARVCHYCLLLFFLPKKKIKIKKGAKEPCKRYRRDADMNWVVQSL